MSDVLLFLVLAKMYFELPPAIEIVLLIWKNR